MEEELEKLCAKDNAEKVKEELEGIENEDGGIHPGKLWALRKKLFPKSRDPPTAMINEEGDLVTSLEEIENLSLKTYKNRLRSRQMVPDLNYLRADKELLCDLKLECARKNTTKSWTMKELEIVLSSLKKNKSRDPLGLANELFSSKIAGTDMKHAVLKLMNQIKTDQVIPEMIKMCNISSIWKRKGSRSTFDNYRGIFRVTILRTILDRLIYNDEYEKIDKSLNDSNVGARKGRNVRDNIFVVNAVLNSASKKKKRQLMFNYMTWKSALTPYGFMIASMIFMMLGSTMISCH